MHIEIRLFPGAAGQAGRLSARRTELEALLRALPGVRSAELAEAREGVVLVVVADERGVAAEGQRRFASWVATQLPGLEWQEAFAVSGPVIATRET